MVVMSASERACQHVPPGGRSSDAEDKGGVRVWNLHCWGRGPPGGEGAAQAHVVSTWICGSPIVDKDRILVSEVRPRRDKNSSSNDKREGTAVEPSSP